MHGYDSPEEFLAEVSNVALQLFVNPGRMEELRQMLAKYGIVRSAEVEVYRRDRTKKWVLVNLRCGQWTNHLGLRNCRALVEQSASARIREELLVLRRSLVTHATRGYGFPLLNREVHAGKDYAARWYVRHRTAIISSELLCLIPPSQSSLTNRAKCQNKQEQSDLDKAVPAVRRFSLAAWCAQPLG
jgi:hypothetical protein